MAYVSCHASHVFCLCILPFDTFLDLAYFQDRYEQVNCRLWVCIKAQASILTERFPKS